MAPKIDDSHREIMREIKELRQEQNKHAEEMSSRVGALERWRWAIVGGATAVGIIFAAVTHFFSKLMLKLLAVVDVLVYTDFYEQFYRHKIPTPVIFSA